MFNATSSQNPQVYSTDLKLIRPTPIPLLSSSIFSWLKINGLQLTSPQFILATELTLRSAEYKSSRGNGFSSNLSFLIPNNSSSSFFQSRCNRNFPATSMLDLPVPTWENIKHWTSFDLDFSGQASERMSLHGSKAAHTAYHIIYGWIVNRNFTCFGQWQSHFISCMSTSGIQVQLF